MEGKSFLFTKRRDDSFTRLMECHSEGVYRYVLSKVHKAEVAEDITQDTFTKAYQHMDKIEGMESKDARNYILKIAKNLALKYLQKSNGQNFCDLDDCEDQLATESADPVWQKIANASMWKILIGIIERLGEPDCTLVIESQYFGRSYKELASMLNMTESNVSVRISRAKQRIRKLYIIETQEEELPDGCF